MNTILQVPVDKNLRDKASRVSEKMGFSSLQESIRIFLSRLAAEEIHINFEPTVRLSEKNEKRYLKMLKDIKSGKAKTKTFTDIDSLMKDLLNED